MLRVARIDWERAIRVVYWLCGLLLLSACSSPDRPAPAETGQLSLPLVTTAADGSTVRLRGTFILRGFINGEELRIVLSTLANPEQTELVTTLPPGFYEVQLQEAWALERLEQDGTWARLNARFADGEEGTKTLRIQPGETATVVFRFLSRGLTQADSTLVIDFEVDTEAVCGNGTVEAGEVCDDGFNNGAPTRCDRACQSVCEGACPLRVNPNASVSGSGASWDDPLASIQAAIDIQGTHGGGEVWVLAGEYDPPAIDEFTLLELRSNVLLLGGFQGTETSPAQRDLSVFTTIRDPRPFASEPAVLGGTLKVAGQQNVWLENIAISPRFSALYVQGSQKVALRRVHIGRSSSSPAGVQVLSSDARFEQLTLVEQTMEFEDSRVAIWDSRINGFFDDYIRATHTELALIRVDSHSPVLASQQSSLFIQNTFLRGSSLRGGVIQGEIYGSDGVSILLVDSAVLSGGSLSPILADSVFAWNSSFTNMNSGPAGGSSPNAAAIEADRLEVSLSTFFNNRCTNQGFPCGSDLRATESSVVNNSLFVLPEPPFNPFPPPPPPVPPDPWDEHGNCRTPDREPYNVDQTTGTVLAIEHPCRDRGNAEELEASRLRLLERAEAFRAAPFFADLSAYEDESWWRDRSVLAAECTDEAEPDSGRHFLPAGCE